MIQKILLMPAFKSQVLRGRRRGDSSFKFTSQDEYLLLESLSHVVTASESGGQTRPRPGGPGHGLSRLGT